MQVKHLFQKNFFKKIKKFLSLFLALHDPKEKAKSIKKITSLSQMTVLKKKIKNGEFIEHASVFGYRYGTLAQTVNSLFNKKKDVLFDIDWQGFQQLKQSGLEVVGIFILPPNKKELISRLKKRGRDTSEEMKKRMSLALDEISHFLEYEYVVINKDLDFCSEQIKNIIKTERLKRSRQTDLPKFISKFRN